MPDVPEKKGRKYSRLAAAAIVDQRLSGEVLRVLAMLGIFADKAGTCYPAITTMAANLGIGRRTIQRHLRKLERLGYIVTEPTTRHTKGGWGRNQYCLHFRPIHLIKAPPRTDNKRKREATPAVAPLACDTDAKDPQARRHLATGEATPAVAPGATFGDRRGDTSRRPIIPMKINPSNQPSANQPNGRGEVVRLEVMRATKADEESDPDDELWRSRGKIAVAALRLHDKAKHDAICEQIMNWEAGRQATWPPPAYPELEEK